MLAKTPALSRAGCGAPATRAEPPLVARERNFTSFLSRALSLWSRALRLHDCNFDDAAVIGVGHPLANLLPFAKLPDRIRDPSLRYHREVDLAPK